MLLFAPSGLFSSNRTLRRVLFLQTRTHARTHARTKTHRTSSSHERTAAGVVFTQRKKRKASSLGDLWSQNDGIVVRAIILRCLVRMELKTTKDKTRRLKHLRTLIRHSPRRKRRQSVTPGKSGFRRIGGEEMIQVPKQQRAARALVRNGAKSRELLIYSGYEKSAI